MAFLGAASCLGNVHLHRRFVMLNSSLISKTIKWRIGSWQSSSGGKKKKKKKKEDNLMYYICYFSIITSLSLRCFCIIKLFRIFCLRTNTVRSKILILAYYSVKQLHKYSMNHQLVFQDFVLAMFYIRYSIEVT